jgi:hypothetical protein
VRGLGTQCVVLSNNCVLGGWSVCIHGLQPASTEKMVRCVPKLIKRWPGKVIKFVDLGMDGPKAKSTDRRYGRPDENAVDLDNMGLEHCGLNSVIYGIGLLFIRIVYQQAG